MDIHAPHEPVHTWRDFFTHLAIVTIGLFIALMLEALVEHIHHVHLVREARANIRRELRDNHNAAQQDLILILQNIETEKQDIVQIHALQEHTQAHVSISNHFDFNSANDSAWHTARDTGALGFMPSDEVQRYADIYMLANFVNTHAIDTAERDFLAQAPFKMDYDPDKLPPDLYMQLLHDNAAVEIQLTTLHQIVQQFDDACVAELKR